MLVTHFIVSDDVERSRRFSTEVLGGTEVFRPVPANIALANTFIVINAGGGPTGRRSRLRHHAIPIGSAPFSTFASQTSTRCTRNGELGVLNF
jgi:hypothetical protein